MGAGTVVDLVMERPGEMPKVGHHDLIDFWRAEIVDMDCSQIDEVIIERGTAG